MRRRRVERDDIGVDHAYTLNPPTRLNITTTFFDGLFPLIIFFMITVVE